VGVGWLGVGVGSGWEMREIGVGEWCDLLELKPDTERLVQEEIRRGHFHSVDELIIERVNAWREKHQVEPSTAGPRKKLYDGLVFGV
jgi:hypothetical protein